MTPEQTENLGSEIEETLRAGDWGRAIPLLETWCRLHPEHGPGWRWLAKCLSRENQPAAALDCARRAQALEPENTAVRELVLTLERQGSAAGPLPETAPAGTPADTTASPDEDQPRPQDPVSRSAQDAESGEPETSSTDTAEPKKPDPPGLPGDRSETGRPATGNDAVLEASRLAGPTTPSPPAGASTPLLWQEGTVVDGRYEVRGVARGGMGEVYFVLDRELGLPVAVKTPLPSVLATDSGRGRFLREAEAWIALGLHPNICTAYYVRMVGGLPRLFIEYLDGGDLLGWMQTQPSSGVEDRLDLAIQIASGMHHAHTFEWRDEDGNDRYGVVHRDLKPANILLGSDGLVRVTDFGLVGRGLGLEDDRSTEETTEQAVPEPTDSGQVWSTMTMGGVVMGTPPYMPPEQWRGAHAAGAPADIYAFGCIMFELFCGRRAFVLEEFLQNANLALQLAEWQKLHADGEIPNPRIFTTDLDEELSAIIRQCLAKEASVRPPSFEAVRTALVEVYQRVSGKPYNRPLPQPARLLADSWNNRGVSFATLGQTTRSQDAWRSALEADPHHVEASFNLALSQWRQGVVSDREIAHRMDEVKASQESSWRHEQLGGRLALCLDRIETALASLRSALEASNGAAQVARDYALALAASATDADDPELWSETATILSTRCAELATDPAVLTTYALAMDRLGRTQESERLYNAARRYDDTLPADLESGAASVVPGIRQRLRLRGVLGRVTKTAVSAEGRTGVAVAEGGKIHVWDLTTGEVVRTMQPAGGKVRVLALDPQGKIALTSVEGAPVDIWDLGSGVIQHRLQAHAGMLNQIVVAPDGQRALGVGTARELNVWSLATRSLTGVFAGHDGFAMCVAAATDGATALTGGSRGELLLWNTEEGSVAARLAMHEATVTAVAIGPRVLRAVSGCESGAVGVWDFQSRRRLHFLRGHTGAITFVSLSDDESRCLTGSADGTLRLWDLDRGEPIAVRRLEGGVADADATFDWSVILLGHGNRVSLCSARVVGGYRPGWAFATPVRVIEAQERAGEFEMLIESSRRRFSENDPALALKLVEEARAIPGYERSSEALELTEKITAGQPRTRLRTGWEERTIDAHGGRTLALDVSPDGRHMTSAGTDHQLVTWDLRTGGATSRIDLPQFATSIAVVDGGRRVVSGDLLGNLKVHEIGSGRCLHTLTGHEAGINDLAASFDGRAVLTASSDQTARLWHLVSGRCIHRLEGHTGEVRSVAMSPDRRFGATGGDDGSVVLWSLLRATSIRSLDGHVGPVNGLVWSGDGRRLLSAGSDGAVRVWDVTSGSCRRTIDCQDPVAAVALSPDGNTAAAGCRDGSVQLWQIASGEQARTFSGHGAIVSAVSFTPDGRRVVSSDDEGMVRSWYLDWEFAIRKRVDWHDSVRPYLEVFLAQRGNPEGTAPPEWGDGEIRALVADLGNRGLGWINPGGVTRQLRRMANDWKPRSTGSASRRQHAPPSTPVTPKQRRARRTHLRIAAAVLSLALLGVLAVSHMLSLQRIDYNDRQLAATRREVIRARVPPPPAFTRGVNCLPEQAQNYARTFTIGAAPEIHFQAQYCLEDLDDPTTVKTLLDSLRPQPGPEVVSSGAAGSAAEELSRVQREHATGRESTSDVLTVLARMGDASTHAIARFIADPEPMVSSTATNALAFRGSETAVEVLLEHSSHPDSRVRALIARNLRYILSSGKRSRTEALEILDRMAADSTAEVRRGVAESLALFQGTAVQDLARRLARDRDQEVSDAAREVLKRL
jgi:WD40 repeat protein/serine/threonine protein kinase